MSRIRCQRGKIFTLQKEEKGPSRRSRYQRLHTRSEKDETLSTGTRAEKKIEGIRIRQPRAMGVEGGGNHGAGTGDETTWPASGRQRGARVSEDRDVVSQEVESRRIWGPRKGIEAIKKCMMVIKSPWGSWPSLRAGSEMVKRKGSKKKVPYQRGQGGL